LLHEDTLPKLNEYPKTVRLLDCAQMNGEAGRMNGMIPEMNGG
jgi:hypothetical protein